MKSSVIVLMVLSVLIQSVRLSQVCPDETQDIFPKECSCYNETKDEKASAIFCVNGQAEFTWDIKATFDQIGEILTEETLVIENLKLYNFGLLISPMNIPDNAIAKTKIKNIEIVSNEKILGISENAFSGTIAHTEFLKLSNNKIVSYNEDIFKFMNKFTVITEIDLNIVLVPSIPANAFATGPASLKIFKLYSAGLEKIGDNAFTGLTNLEQLVLTSNQLSLDDISEKAFDDINPVAVVDLRFNNLLTHLTENKFKKLLDSRTTGYVVVGNNGRDDELEVALNCNKESDWICAGADMYQNKLKGFQCREKEFNNVWNYCKNETNPIDDATTEGKSGSSLPVLSAIMLSSVLIFSVLGSLKF